MKKLNMNTKQAQNFIRSYNTATATELSDVYKSWSFKKQDAMLSCKNLYYNTNGERFRIISANTFSFTVAWKTQEGIRVETSNNSYIIK